MSYMFEGCYWVISLDLSGWDTRCVTKMQVMFNSCNRLVTIYASESFDTTNVTNSNNMFEYCHALVGGAGTAYNGNKDKTYARLDEPENDRPGYFTQKP